MLKEYVPQRLTQKFIESKIEETEKLFALHSERRTFHKDTSYSSAINIDEIWYSYKFDCFAERGVCVYINVCVCVCISLFRYASMRVHMYAHTFTSCVCVNQVLIIRQFLYLKWLKLLLFSIHYKKYISINDFLIPKKITTCQISWNLVVLVTNNKLYLKSAIVEHRYDKKLLMKKFCLFCYVINCYFEKTFKTNS